MYHRIEDFIEDWNEESGLTVTIFEAVSEDRKSEHPNDHMRSLERLGWHITQTITEMMHRAGLFETDTLEHLPVPGSFSDITDTYRQQSLILSRAVQEKWTDASLEEVIPMYGQSWKRGQVLSILIRHQIHHRAQMTTLMRVLGMKVPGIYGPAREEWAKMGMPEPVV